VSKVDAYNAYDIYGVYKLYPLKYTLVKKWVHYPSMPSLLTVLLVVLVNISGNKKLLILNFSLYMGFIKLTQKSLKNIVVQDDTYEALRKRGSITDSFNNVISEILRHHESAVSIIGDCESCKAKFKAALQGE
jgi:predicted CopG family antitoxin